MAHFTGFRNGVLKKVRLGKKIVRVAKNLREFAHPFWAVRIYNCFAPSIVALQRIMCTEEWTFRASAMVTGMTHNAVGG